MIRSTVAARVWMLLLHIAIATSCAQTPEREGPRPRNWAQPVERVGLPNLHRVDDRLYRGAQPDEEGLRELEAMGIRTVVNLRQSRRDELGDLELGYEAIPMNAFSLEEKDVIRFLQVATDPERQPVFVYCQHGADRTGTVVAIYRIVVCGWTREEAIEEMTGGGFGFHAIFTNLIRYVREADIKKIARESEVAARR